MWKCRYVKQEMATINEEKAESILLSEVVQQYSGDEKFMKKKILLETSLFSLSQNIT